MKDSFTHLEEGRLRIRARDKQGNPQMAEGRLPAQGTITPVEEFFVVHHYQPHETSPEDWSLAATGTGKSIDLAALRALPRHDVTALLECAGMSRGLLAKTTPGTQFGHGMVGVANWGGARLRDVIAALGLGEDWKTIILRGGDGGIVPPENLESDFSKGLPPEKALHDDTILAYQMNGVDLPWLHGGPVRLVVPGWYGVWWVKWPRTIEVSDEDGYDGFWQNQRYTFQDAEAKQTGMVCEGLPRAYIRSPQEGAELHRGQITVSGLAWAGDTEVAKVDVTLDGGQTWTEARLAPSEGPWVWRTWEAEVEPTGPSGMVKIAARTTDARGRVQDWNSKANRLGYGNNDIHVVHVDVAVP